MTIIIIRAVRGTSWESTAIALQEKTTMPFTPSHVEALTPDGKSYIGAHMDGGVQARPVGYDAGKIAKLPDGYDASVFPDGLCDLRLELPATAAEHDAFYAFLQAKIGTPYDWRAILGFVLPAHEHIKDHAICSALVTLALRAPGCEWFHWRLAAPAHLVGPRDLLLMLSTHMQIPGV
jgi:hypothetical protein